MAAPDGCLGIVATGALDEPLFTWIMNHMPEGTWELVCHPGYLDEELLRVRTRLRDSRATELRLLTSVAARQTLQSEEIELVSFRALART